MKNSLRSALLVLLVAGTDPILFAQKPAPVGQWACELSSPGGPLRFGLIIEENDSGSLAGFITNGVERIKIPISRFDDKQLLLRIDYFNSEIVAQFDSERKRLEGTWTKRKGSKLVEKMEFVATESSSRMAADDSQRFAGRWWVKFSSSDEPAIAVFRDADQGRIQGTFLTTTGDYRYLDGEVRRGELELSCFDGAHAFLFRCRLDDSDQIKGDFWSGSRSHETWIGKRDDAAALPDGFGRAAIVDGVDWGSVKFPDLNGRPRRLDDPEFNGKVRLIYLFGSWCPNCHDAAEFFVRLKQEYGDKGLSVLGLAFEAGGDFESDATQIRLYMERHGADYPVLIAGLADKAVAAKAVPVFDRVRAFPTTMLIDGNGKIRYVYSGFSGPATGSEYEQLTKQFRTKIDALLRERP